MSGRYEVHNRYSAYIEARRHYLEQSDSEEDIEVRTILRRPRTFLTRSISTSSEEQPTPVMAPAPTVSIAQEAPKELIAKEPEPVLIPSSSVVQEIQVVSPTVVDEVKPSKGEQRDACTVCSNVQAFVKPYYESIKAKYNQVVNRLLDPSLHATIRSEFGEYIPAILTAFAFLFFGIVFISFIRLLRHVPHSEQSFFCRYFSRPFAPLFDALCAPEPFSLNAELLRVMSGLVDEMFLTISEFFRTVGKGFTVFGTLLTAIGNGITENVFFGYHELRENVGENINHLFHFIVQFFHQIIHLLLSSIATVSGGIAGVFSSVHDYLDPEPNVW